MLHPWDLHKYQNDAQDFQTRHAHTMLWLGMGLGKTAITLTSAARLLSAGHLRSVLIVAPLRVAQTVWHKEASKWSHLQHLKFSLILGSEQERLSALRARAHVYVINYENLKWLIDLMASHKIDFPFDGVVLDEVSKCKNSTTKRVKALMKIRPNLKWITGLTGTPASNGLKDLHGQYLVVDGGKRLGRGKTHFQSDFFYSDGDYGLTPKDHAFDSIHKLIADITIEMSAEDYLDMPDLRHNTIELYLPPDLQKQYKKLEKDYFIELDSGAEIEAVNAAVKRMKCLQFADGTLYETVVELDEYGEPKRGNPIWHPVHEMKLDALEDIIEEAAGEQILLSYRFKAEAARIMERFKHLDPVNLTETKSVAGMKQVFDRWERGKLPLLIGHPASMGHGIDGLQYHGNTLVRYGITDSLELEQQFIARIMRQGQERPVTCHDMVMQNTLDIVPLKRYSEKDADQRGLLQAVRDYHRNGGK